MAAQVGVPSPVDEFCIILSMLWVKTIYRFFHANMESSISDLDPIAFLTTTAKKINGKSDLRFHRNFFPVQLRQGVVNG